MNGMQPIFDMQRIARLEAESARPHAITQSYVERRPRGSLITASRQRMTVLLRRVADVLEPAPSRAAVAGNPDPSGC